MERDAARRVLKVTPGASTAEIEQAFRRVARVLHPDAGGDPEAFRTALEARDVLLRHPASAGPRTRLIVTQSPSSRLLTVLRALGERLRDATGIGVR